MTVVWVLVWVAVIVFFAVMIVRERRSGKQYRSDAARSRRDDMFRMQVGASYFKSEMPAKDPNRDRQRGR